MERYKGKKVLVTGGAGFVGSHLVEKLVHLGAHVTVLDDLSTGKEINLHAVKDRINFIHGSIVDLAVCIHATQSIDYVFHLAALVSVPQSVQEPEKCNAINITGTFNILEACRLNAIERIIFSSSCAVYGAHQGICSEESPCNPTSPYGYSKLMGEIYMQQYAHLFGLHTICLRYFNIYGPRQNPHGAYAGVIAKFKHQLEHNLPLTIFGDGKQTRDFVPVEEIVRANLTLALLPAQKMKGNVYNIGTGKSITLLEIIDQLKREYPRSTSQIEFKPARQGDIHYSAADCSKYKNLLL